MPRIWCWASGRWCGSWGRCRGSWCGTTSPGLAAYANALHAPVHRRDGGPHTWIETRGAIAGHPVHAWTIADPAAQAVT
jgi:hypothetical protein